MAKKKLNKQKSEQKLRGPVLVGGTLVALVIVGMAAFTFVKVSGSAQNASFVNVSVQDLADADEPERVILDVREPWEYEQGHVPGVTLIPLAELETRVDELPDDAPIYVICRSGNRSTTASKILISAGKQDVRNVQGGILAWQQAGLPVEQ